MPADSRRSTPSSPFPMWMSAGDQSHRSPSIVSAPADVGYLFGSPLPKRLKAPWHLDSAAISAWACSPSVGRLGSRRKDRRAKIFARRCCFRGDTPSRRVPEKWRDAASTWEPGRPARKPSPQAIRQPSHHSGRDAGIRCRGRQNRRNQQWWAQPTLPAGIPPGTTKSGFSQGSIARALDR